MKTCMKFLAVVFLAVAFVFGLTGLNTAHAATAPNLGAADSYAVFGKAGVTDTDGTTHVWGDAGADSSVGLIQSQVGGAIITDGDTAGVATDATAAYLDLMSATQGTPPAGIFDLAGTHTIANGNPITPGVYNVGATTLNGAVELSGAGVYIFRSSSSLTIATSGGTMTLRNGATACNVFWAVPASMTIGTGSQMIGTIIASTGLISLGTDASLVGRAISLTKAVTLDANQITEPTCTASESESESESASASENDNDVAIKVTKKADPSTLSGPGWVTYTYKVTNEGDVALRDVSVEDDKCSPVVYVSGRKNQNGKLDTDETWKYTCSKKVSATETNKATAKGTANGKKVHDHAKATVVVSLVPGFPNAGVGPYEKNTPWNIVIPAGILMLISTSLSIVKRKRNI